MLKIRLKPVGKKNDKSYRIIVTQAGQSITSGHYLDQVGFYDPRSDKKDIDGDKVKSWLAKGAQPSDTVYNLLIDTQVIEGRKKNVLPRKSAPVVESSDEMASPTAEQATDESEASDEVAAETQEGTDDATLTETPDDTVEAVVAEPVESSEDEAKTA